MMDIRMPNITATTPQGQMEQVRSYLFQMVQQLNFSLKAVEEKALEAQTTAEGSAKNEVQQAQSTFNSIKGMIIKSADIVNAYTEVISHQLEGQYVAKSDFGTFLNTTIADIQADSEAIEQKYGNFQEILDALGERVSEIAANAYIRSGLLDYSDDGHGIYGIEIGQTDTEDGVVTFNRYSRFTSDGLSFFDNNGIETAYIKNSTLYITNAVVKGTLQVGKYVLDPTYGLALLWMGG